MQHELARQDQEICELKNQLEQSNNENVAIVLDIA